jgi:hypothetical protein
MRTDSGVVTARAAARPRAAPTKRARGVISIWARTRMESPLGVLGLCLALALVLASAWFASQFVAFSFSLHTMTGSWALYEDPMAKTRVGEILFTPFDGNACRKILFNNQTGRFGPDQNVRCDTGLAPGAPGSDIVRHSTGATERMSSIRDAFAVRPAR